MKTVTTRRCFLAAVVILLASGPGVVACATAQDQQAAVVQQESTAQPAADAGLKVYLDPETGEFLDEPLPGQADSNANDRQVERAPLVEEPSPVEGGGTMIRLDDRFRAEFRASVDADGRLKADCAQPSE